MNLFRLHLKIENWRKEHDDLKKERLKSGPKSVNKNVPPYLNVLEYYLLCNVMHKKPDGHVGILIARSWIKEHNDLEQQRLKSPV